MDRAALERVAPSLVAVTAALVAVGLMLVGGLSAPAESLLVLSVALCALGYGLPGGVVAASVALALNTTSLLVDQGAAVVDFSAHSVTFVLVGCLGGWFVDQRRALAAAVERHEALSADLVGEADFDGFFTRVNPAWTRLLAHSAEELIARPYLDFVHPDDRALTVAAAAQQTEAGQEVTRFENRYRHKDGSYRWLEWSSRPDVGRRQLIAVARDVTERKLTEARDTQRAEELGLALEDSREANVRLNLVAEAVFDALITVDAEGKILRFNTSAERIFGYPRAELIGKTTEVLTAEKGQEGYIARYVRTGDEGLVGARYEMLGRRKNGCIFPMELAIGEVRRRGERDFVCVVRDITERKRREEAELQFTDILRGAVQERTAELKERTKELDEARLETLRKLALAAECRDDQTFEHAERVGNTAAQLGELLGLTAVEVERIRQAAPLHDIGKLAVSDTILLEPGELTDDQWEQMRSHPMTGNEILAGSNSDVLSLAAEIALSHHEWWDGSGYPSGLKGEQIPLSGRIAAVADVFDSLCHDRPYKRAWTVEHAVAEIHRLRGRQFDPAVVDAFEQLDPHQLVGDASTDAPAAILGETSRNGQAPAAAAARSIAPDEEPTENAAGPATANGNQTGPRSDDRYRRLVERSNDMIFLLDLEGTISSVNPATKHITGYSPEETVGTDFLQYISRADLERAGTLFARLVAGADVFSEELELVSKDGRSVFLDVSARPIVEGGQLVGVEGIARDVTERRALLDALTYQSLHDPLTGLPNRTLFGDRLAHALTRRDSPTVALILLDLDNFKQVNDNLGHDVGDQVLVVVASRLTRELRKSETVMRLGGDEFAAIVEDANTEAELAAVATRILSALSEPIATDDRIGQITASLGIATSQPGDDPAALLRKADIAMYQAKAAHPGGYRFYCPKTPELPPPRSARPRAAARN